MSKFKKNPIFTVEDMIKEVDSDGDGRIDFLGECSVMISMS